MENFISTIMNTYTDKYTSICDFATLYISILMILMMLPFSSFREKNSNRKKLLVCLSLIIFSCISNIFFNFCIIILEKVSFITYLSHFVFLTNMAIVFYIFTIFYLSLTIHRNNAYKHHIAIVTMSLFIYILSRVILFLQHKIIINPGVVQDKLYINTSIIYYTILGIENIIIFIFYDKEKNITHKPVKISAFITYLLLWVSIVFCHTTSLVTMLVVAPTIALMVYHHSYSFEVESGAIDKRGMIHKLNKFFKYNIKNTTVSGTIIYLMSPTPTKMLFKQIQFGLPYKKHVELFRTTEENQYIYLYLDKNKDLIRNYLKQSLEESKIDFIAYSFDSLKSVDEVVSVINGVYSEYKFDGSSKFELLSQDEINNFVRKNYILNELFKIHQDNNLNDPRVLVYCQPIYNTKTKTFDTAESLIRLNLDDIGLVQPGEFISLAEKNRLLHILTLIALNKVCKKLKELNDNGYEINRISINLSVYEANNEKTKEDFLNILKRYNIAPNQIAIEITESDENDILIDKLNKLKKIGFMIYLDDFGTGYSNFARILKLPFDVIKFDMSLLQQDEYQKSFSDTFNGIIPIFKKNKYLLVHEGIETQEDEDKCIENGFDYLQGYKYSKPIPIEKLNDFLNHK